MLLLQPQTENACNLHNCWVNAYIDLRMDDRLLYCSNKVRFALVRVCIAFVFEPAPRSMNYGMRTITRMDTIPNTHDPEWAPSQ